MKKIYFLACALGMSALVSCEKESEASAESSTISGSAVKGSVASARVDVYEFLASGQRGKLIASTTTDAKGSYSVKTTYRGPAEVVVSQGSYKDEATGTTVSLNSTELRSVIKIEKADRTAAVTALTTIAAEHVKANAAVGLETAMANANQKVAEAFGLAGVDLGKEIPADLSQANTGLTQAQVKYGAVQAGLSQAIKESNLPADKLLTLVQDLAKDLTDGKIDGKSGSTALNSALTLTPTQALTGLNTAIENFMKSSSNKSGQAAGAVSVTIPTPGR